MQTHINNTWVDGQFFSISNSVSLHKGSLRCHVTAAGTKSRFQIKNRPYLQIVVVFYVAIVLLLIGTNLKAGRVTRGARFKQHVVEFTEGNGAANRLVPSSRNGGSTNHGGKAVIGADQEDDIVEV